MNPFSHAGDVDPRYAFIRDHAPGLRRRLSAEWARFSDLADPDFLTQLAQDFESRAWEMRVGALLRELRGSEAVSSKPAGLDFKVGVEQTIWVECVACTQRRFSDPPIAIRLTHPQRGCPRCGSPLYSLADVFGPGFSPKSTSSDEAQSTMPLLHRYLETIYEFRCAFFHGDLVPSDTQVQEVARLAHQSLSGLMRSSMPP